VAILNKGEKVAEGGLGNLLSKSIREVEVVMSDLPREMLEKAKAIDGVRVVETPDETMCVFKHEEHARSLVTHGLDAGAKLMSFTPRRESLEDYFIDKVTSDGGVPEIPDAPRHADPVDFSVAKSPAVEAAPAPPLEEEAVVEEAVDIDQTMEQDFSEVSDPSFTPGTEIPAEPLEPSLDSPVKEPPAILADLEAEAPNDIDLHDHSKDDENKPDAPFV